MKTAASKIQNLDCGAATAPGTAQKVDTVSLSEKICQLDASPTSPLGVWVNMTPRSEKPISEPPPPQHPVGLFAHSHPFYGNLPSVNGRARLTPGNFLVGSSTASPARRQQNSKPSSTIAEGSVGTDSSDAGDEGLATAEAAGKPPKMDEADSDDDWMMQTPRSCGKKFSMRHPEKPPSARLRGLLHRAAYLGSTQLALEARPSRATRMALAQEAVVRIKAPDGEKQPSVPVDLFVSIERLMVLNPTSRLAMMDHALRTVTHTADMDNLLVLMVRRAGCPTGTAGPCKVVCHLFHTDQASQVAHTIGCAFNAAYAQFVHRGGAVPPKTTPGNDGDSVSGTSAVRVDFDNDNDQVDDSDNGLEDTAPLEVTIYKERGEALGIALVDSGWGALLPSVLLANLRPGGPAVRSGQLSVGDFLLAVDGTSLVGLPLAACRRRLRACRSAATVRLRVLPRPPVSEAVIQRLDPRRPLGFSVRDGVVCALLRGGVAERGGVRIGHRIVEIDGRSVAAAPHDRIVAALASAVGEIRLRTMPEAVYRLLTGLDSPRYV